MGVCAVVVAASRCVATRPEPEAIRGDFWRGGSGRYRFVPPLLYFNDGWWNDPVPRRGAAGDAVGWSCADSRRGATMRILCGACWEMPCAGGATPRSVGGLGVEAPPGRGPVAVASVHLLYCQTSPEQCFGLGRSVCSCRCVRDASVARAEGLHSGWKMGYDAFRAMARADDAICFGLSMPPPGPGGGGEKHSHGKKGGQKKGERLRVINIMPHCGDMI